MTFFMASLLRAVALWALCVAVLPAVAAERSLDKEVIIKASLDQAWPPHLPEARAQRTFVILRFEPVSETETRVRLHHTGWGEGGEWDKAYAYFDRAWGNVLANLKKRYDSGCRTGPSGWPSWRSGAPSRRLLQRLPQRASEGYSSSLTL